MKKYMSPIVEIYDYITEDVMMASSAWKNDNTFAFPLLGWIDEIGG